MQENQTAYLEKYKSGALKKIKEELIRRLENCTLCPRNCNVNRLKRETGICSTGRKAVVASCSPHFGEEDPLVGTQGSGTIFFSFCNLLCSFCQNFEISHMGEGSLVSDEKIAEMMIALQNMGCHNINFVTPGHVIPQIVSAVEIAASKGLCIPLVYNTSAYDKVSTLEILKGIFNIYMPDFKFTQSEFAKKVCNSPDYPEVAKAAIKEMYRQVGDLQTDDDGIANRGLLVRHLVMPDSLEDTENILEFITEEISKNTYINIMSQYRPAGKAIMNSKLARSITHEEFISAISTARKKGLKRIDNEL